MKNRILALSCLCVLVMNLAGSTVGEAAANRVVSAQANQLATLLPDVDSVVTIDAKRFFSVAMPKLLSGNPTLLGKVTSGIDQMKADSGVDVRQFDHIAAGFSVKKAGAKDIDGEPIVIARGQVSAASVIESAKAAAKGKHREEKVLLHRPRITEKPTPADSGTHAVAAAVQQLPEPLAALEEALGRTAAQ